MSLSVKSLRRGVLAGGLVLLVVLAGFLGIARLRGHRFHFDLPGRLGVEISQTANGFTFSKSQNGHTLFTIHASKLVQYKDDQAELHDVTITLYGPEGSGRSDKIYGSDFTYNRKQGIARATGAVQIDFASPAIKAAELPAQTGATSPAAALQPAAVPNNMPASTIHVTTSGVTFNQQTGEAETDQRVDFTFTRATGSSTGANYNAKTGILVLDREVALATGADALPAGAVVHAAHAQLLRDSHQAYLIQPEVSYQETRTSSDQAILTFRPDGSAENVDARGHVRMRTEEGAEAHSATARLDLDAQSQPVVARLEGGVTYHSEKDGETMQGSAVSGTMSFSSAPSGKGRRGAAGAAGLAPPQPFTSQPVTARTAPAQPGTAKAATVQVLHHAQFRDAVSFVLQRQSVGASGFSTREIAATQLDIDFAPDATGKAEAQRALGVGGARVKLHEIAAHGPARSTTISGDQLLATFSHGREIQALDGRGNTKIVDALDGAATSTSIGDTLHMTFLGARGLPDTRAASGPGARAASGERTAAAPSSKAGSTSTQIDTAVQTGHVAMTQTPAPDAKPGASQSPFRATAEKAVYRSADQVLHLTGDPHLRNDTLILTAEAVDYHRDSGDAAAMGNVKSTYLQQAGQTAPTLGGEGPVHIVADHAQLTRSNNLSIFYGTPNTLARMWQGSDAVAAPVLELSRDQQTLDAHSEAGQKAPLVHATLGSRGDRAKSGAEPSFTIERESPGQPGAALATQAGKQAQPRPASTAPGPTRVVCAALHYSDKDRRAELHGAVVATQPSGVVHSDEAEVYLTPNVAGEPSALDHLVATNHVLITQPGRRGTGSKLVYTAAEDRYVLTGSPHELPRITDAEKGTTTGAALIFRGGDGSVEVSNLPGPLSGPDAGSAASAYHTRTVTDTHSPR